MQYSQPRVMCMNFYVTKQKSGKSHIHYYFLIRLIAVSKHIFKKRLIKM